MEENRKYIETWNVINYLKDSDEEVSVKELLDRVEVHKLRIYGIIVELQQIHYIEVTHSSPWGAPLTVKRISDTLPPPDFY